MPTTVKDLAEQIYEWALFECRQSLPDYDPFEVESEPQKVSKETHEYAYEQYLGLIDYCELALEFKNWLEADQASKVIESEVEPIQKAIEVCISDCEALMETW